MTEHNFAECLAASHAAEDLPLWRECYRQWFPGFVAMTSHRRDGEQQREERWGALYGGQWRHVGAESIDLPD